MTADGDAVRPLARDREAFAALLADREPLYREVARLTVDTAERDPAEAASHIIRLLGGVVPEDHQDVRGAREGAA